MSTAQKGNQRVDAAAESLGLAGYRIACIKASGRRGDRRRAYHIAGDFLAVRGDGGLVLQVEVGGDKPIAASLRELAEAAWPDAVPMLVRFVGRRREYHALHNGQELRSYALSTILIALGDNVDRLLS